MNKGLKNIRVKRTDGKRGMIIGYFRIYQVDKIKYKLIINWMGPRFYFYGMVDEKSKPCCEGGTFVACNLIPRHILLDFIKRVEE